MDAKYFYKQNELCLKLVLLPLLLVAKLIKAVYKAIKTRLHSNPQPNPHN